MRISHRLSFAVGAALMLAGTGAAISAEIPSVYVQPNASGMITISYAHSGVGGVREYQVQRQGGATYVMYSPNGQYIDVFLEPSTAYTYRVCAVYLRNAEAACSEWITVETFPPQVAGNYDPPIISTMDIKSDRITVWWGPTGTYSKILARIEGDGRSFQADLPNTPYGSYEFVNLRSGVTYRLLLMGCNPSLIASNCGDWSPPVEARTASPLPEFLPPSNVTIAITGYTDTTLDLAFSVNARHQNTIDRFVLLRDGGEYQVVKPIIREGGWTAAFTDTVQQTHKYQVCFNSTMPVAYVCSDTITDPVITHADLGDNVLDRNRRGRGAVDAARSIFGNQ